MKDIPARNPALPPFPGWRYLERDGIGAFRLDAPGPFSAFLTRPAGIFPALEQVAQAFELSGIITLRQVHSDRVIPADAVPQPDMVEADALYTDRSGFGIAIRVADCLPVYIRGRNGGVAGIAHAGWRGTKARIAEKLALAISRRFKLAPAELEFALGPCICPDCYEVAPEVAEQFRSYAAAGAGVLRPAGNSGRLLLDIRAANRIQLRALGLTELPGLALCTKESPQTCFSFRRDGRTGHNLALIALGSGGDTGGS